MITPRHKAIVVGAMFGGAKMIKNGGYHVLNYEHFDAIMRTWLDNNLQDIDNTLCAGQFFSVVYDKFKDNNWPEDYFNKMSPLAIAVNMACVYAGGEAPESFDEKAAAKSFLTRWGIDILKTGSEDDAINSWLLTKQHLLEICPSLAPMEILIKYPRKHKLIYLSGGQQFAKDGGVNWRAKISPALYKLGYDVFNPAYEGSAVLDKYGVNLSQLSLDDYIEAGRLFIEKDLEAIKSSDAIITFWDESAALGSGTRAEMTIAYDYNIPNYIVIDKGINVRDLSIWLCGSMKNRKFICETFDDAIEKVKSATLDG